MRRPLSRRVVSCAQRFVAPAHLRVVRVAIAALVAVGLGSGAAEGIETETFGIEPVRESADSPIRVRFRPGGETTETFRVFNKSDAELRLDLAVKSAVIPRDGGPRLGGDSPAVEWSSVRPSSLVLGPGASETVTLAVEAPHAAPRRAVVAVLVQPPPQGQVVQRVGIVVDLRRGTPVDDRGVGPVLWIAVVAVIALAGSGFAAWRTGRSRRHA